VSQKVELATGFIIMPKQRLDNLLVSRGLAENKSKAQACILAGDVLVDGQVVTRAGSLFSPDVNIQLRQKAPFVSRGGLKLQHALRQFGINVKGMVCLDVGASTGGFTDCLLQGGARRVYAIDVGYNQIDYKLRQDSRVIVMERVNAHYPFELPEKVDLSVMDLSFISIRKVIPGIVPHLKHGANMLILFKPQFEAKRSQVGKGGVIKDPLVHALVINDFIIWMNENNFKLLNLTASPISGADGNREFLIYMRPPRI